MRAVDLLRLRALQASADGHFDAEADDAEAEALPSPCISVCRMSPERGHCEGCFRTLDEIRIWSRADASQRRGIWLRLLDRAGIALALRER